MFQNRSIILEQAIFTFLSDFVHQQQISMNIRGLNSLSDNFHIIRSESKEISQLFIEDLELENLNTLNFGEEIEKSYVDE